MRPPATPRLRALRAPLVRTALALAALGAAACGDDDPTSPGAGDVEIENVRLTVTPPGGAAVRYTVNANSQNAAPVALRVGTSTITAEPLDDAGRLVDEAPEFELRLVELPAGVTSTPNGTLTATVTATAAAAAAGPAVVGAQMWHRSEGHEDFQARFRITVSP